MKAKVPAETRTNQITRRFSRAVFAVCLTVLTLVLAGGTIFADIVRPPFVSWIPDQRISSGGFTTKYFRIFNYETISMIATPMAEKLDTGLPTVTVSVSKCTSPDFLLGCADDGTGYKVTFSGMPADGDSTTVRVKAKNMGAGAPYGYTSFTLRCDTSGINPPRISNLPNRTLRLPLSGQEEYDTMFVIGDLTEDHPPMEDFQDITQITASSYNTTVIATPSITLLPSDDPYIPLEGPRDYLLAAKTPQTGATPGVATLRVNVTDPDMPTNNTTSGSCVVQVSANSNAIPSFTPSPDGTYLVCPVPTPSPLPQYRYFVASNDSTPVTQLRVQATSSNTLLVPNDAAHLSCSPPGGDGMGMVSITPLLPLPAPGVPQASTITLTVTDELHTRQTTFLYIVQDAASPLLAFSRPSGVYSLDPNKSQHRDREFLTGEMHSVRWAQVEQSIGNYFWGPGDGTTLNDVIADLPGGQDLSLNLQQEPCYIAQTQTCDETLGQQPCLDFEPWCDTDISREPHSADGECDPDECVSGVSYRRAVPWDTYLWQRREAFLDALKVDLDSVDRLDDLSVINTNLPGGFNGIRNTSIGFENMTGYTRERLLGAIQHELRSVQNKFPRRAGPDRLLHQHHGWQ